MAGETVLVTGATGFIAAHTILALLDKGYAVRGTARSKGREPGLNQTLSAYAGKPVAVELFEADLSSDAGWEAAVAGCDYVCHIASPIPPNLPRDPNELIVPARDGALRVLRAAKAAGVRRVVMTSSAAAIAYGWGDKRPEVLDETHWSNPDNLKDNTAYTRSKTIAEKAAWEYMSDEGAGLELTTINPVAVLGPVMSGDFSASVEIVTQTMGGKLPAAPRVGFQIVDVRDVADAHVLAMETPEAAGERFIVADEFMWFSEVADLLRGKFPNFSKKIPKGKLPSVLVRVLSAVNPPLKQIIPELDKRRYATSEKAKRVLGWTARSADEATIAAAESLIKHGVLKA
ncbi:MAG: aldehyde reductase [Pseudomonadota bacterium]